MKRRGLTGVVLVTTGFGKRTGDRHPALKAQGSAYRQVTIQVR